VYEDNINILIWSRRIDSEQAVTGITIHDNITSRINLDHLVSIIIPTKNSSATIENCLISVKQQTYKNVEIIIVDGQSSDNTVLVASRLGAQVIQVDSERVKAKNIGISKAIGEFLLFVDSDMILGAKVLEECVRTCNEDDIAGVIIPERSIGSSFWVKVRDFERSLYTGSRIESARFFKREYVIRVNGFDEEYIFFEESTLPQKIERLGVRVDARMTSSILHNEEGFNLQGWLRKKKYYYESAKQYSKKYDYAKQQMSISYRLALFLSNGKWMTLLRHPVLSTGLFLLKTLEFLSTKL
jgi:glycosyltransferase involved in cell wall biosynthesis